MANPDTQRQDLEQGGAQPGLGRTRSRRRADHADHRRPDQPVALAGHDRRWHGQRHRRVDGRAARRCRGRLADGSREPGRRGHWLPGAGLGRHPGRVRAARSPCTSGRCGPSSSARSTPSARASSSASSPRPTRTTSTASSLQAVGATLGVFAVMLVLYRTQIIKVTDRFRRIVITATLGSDGVLPRLVRHQPVRWRRRQLPQLDQRCSASASASSPPAWRR